MNKKTIYKRHCMWYNKRHPHNLVDDLTTYIKYSLRDRILWLEKYCREDGLHITLMKFNKAVPQGTPVIQTLALDNYGILHIVAEEQMYHSKLDTTFQLSNQMTDEEMNKAAIRMSSANIE